MNAKPYIPPDLRTRVTEQARQRDGEPFVEVKSGVILFEKIAAINEGR